MTAQAQAAGYTFTETPDEIEWKATYYVYCERTGHFKDTARPCWEQFFANVDQIDAQVTREKHLSQYRTDTEPWIYRAGYTVSSKPSTLPDGYHVTELSAGSYLRFTMIGDYSHLPEACGRMFDTVAKQYKSRVKKDWNLEHYVNNPKTAKSEELITEMLIPIKSACEGSGEVSSAYKLTETPEAVEWKPYYYVYCERKGCFAETAKSCWDQMKTHLAEIKAQTTVEKYIAQYRTDTEPWIYRAGVTVSSPPATLPDGYHMEHCSGGPYLSFTLTGDWSHLPLACGRVFHLIQHVIKPELRHDWNLEYYVSDMAHTKPEELMTQILVPVKSHASA